MRTFLGSCERRWVWRCRSRRGRPTAIRPWPSSSRPSRLTAAPRRWPRRGNARAGQGAIVLNNNEVPFKTEETVRFPDHCRVDLDLGRTRLVVVLNGDKGWMQAGGATQPMNKDTYAERRDELYVWWLMTLTPLLKDGFELKPLADAKVNDKEAAVVKVSRKDRPDVRLYFDKKSGLLIKIARRGQNAGVPINMEYHYSDHKDYDGVKWPGKELTTMNGTKLSEVKFTSYKSL